MTDAISQFIAGKFGRAIRHDEPLEFTVDEFRQAACLAAALSGDEVRAALVGALLMIRDLPAIEAASRSRMIARETLRGLGLDKGIGEGAHA